jgi:hypothetical protein
VLISGPKRRSPVKTRLPHSRMTGLPAPTFWHAKLRLSLPLSTSRVGLLSSPMNRGPLHAGKEGSGTLGGKAGRSLDAIPGTGTGTLLCLSIITWVLSLSPVSSRVVSPALPSRCLPPSSNHSSLATSAQHHDNQIEACMWCLSIYSLTGSRWQVAGGRWHVHGAWRLLGHGREC